MLCYGVGGAVVPAGPVVLVELVVPLVVPVVVLVVVEMGRVVVRGTPPVPSSVWVVVVVVVEVVFRFSLEDVVVSRYFRVLSSSSSVSFFGVTRLAWAWSVLMKKNEIQHIVSHPFPKLEMLCSNLRSNWRGSSRHNAMLLLLVLLLLHGRHLLLLVVELLLVVVVVLLLLGHGVRRRVRRRRVAVRRVLVAAAAAAVH